MKKQQIIWLGLSHYEVAIKILLWWGGHYNMRNYIKGSQYEEG